MGIINSTPDSFSDGGDYYNNTDKTLNRIKNMLTQGADIIDIGGESTRPGSELINSDEELRRVLPLITAMRQALGEEIIISIDTWKHTVAQEALRAGATMINSLGGLQLDHKLADVVAHYHCPIVIYHIKGEPKTMQQGEITYTDVMQAIADFFTEQLRLGEKAGITRKNFILDPGIGFGKTVEQNLEVIKRLKELQQFDLPVLIGVSRKSHLAMILQEELGEEILPKDRLEASLAETAIAIQNGAQIVRTHDVWETKKFVTVLEKFL